MNDNKQQDVYVAFPKNIQTTDGQRKIDSTVLSGLPDMKTLSIREFDPNENSIANEWYFITLKNEDLNIIDRYLVKCKDAELNQYKLQDQNPVAVFEYAGDYYLFFRDITPKMVFKTSILFILDGNVKIRHPDELRKNGSFIVDERPTAIYDIKKRRILFQNFRRITKIFTGIDKFYREASKEDVSNFKEDMKALIQFNGKFDIGTRNLNLIAQILDAKDPLDESRMQRIRDFTKSFPVKMAGSSFEDEKPFQVSSDKQLNSVLKLIQGWYYSNPITQVPMEANSAK